MADRGRKLFNIGFSKTGTTSIEQALIALGYRMSKGHWKYYYNYYLLAIAVHGDYDELIRYTKQFDAFCDGPWGGGTELYKRLLTEYPDADFVLSLRAPDKWYDSLVTMLSLFDDDERTILSSYHSNGLFGTVYWFRYIFDIDELAGNRDKVISAYNAYNDAVRTHFEQIGKPLLVIDVSTDPAPWQTLCGFLDKPVPDTPFPRLNTAPKDKSVAAQRLRKNIADQLDLDFLLGD
ncbi:MAG: hypothetical protein K0U74_17635 [Alphaproteobacteria bacterium]|nr:hypothetical protein [Alphaproteobacteria bacterium]